MWDSVGERDDEDVSQELVSYTPSTRSYQIRSNWESDAAPSEASATTTAGDPSYHITTKEKGPHAGSTLAASMSTGVVGLLPTVLIGTKSTYTTLVHEGTKVVLPQYALQNSQLVVSHYSVFTSHAPLMGWFPHVIATVSPLTIPLFASTFALAHALDSVHSLTNNWCSLGSALANVTKGAAAGGVIGGLYFGVVSVVGIAHAPLVSTTLCLGWLLSTYLTRPSSSSADLAVGGVANVAGIATFLLTANPWLSLVAALTGSLVGSTLHSWLSSQWTGYLTSRLSDKACGVLGVSPNASKAEVESRYRHLARTFHPDKQGNREMFELIMVAKEILLLTRNDTIVDEPTYRFNLMSLAHSFANSIMSVGTHSDDRRRKPLELPTDYLDSPD